MDVRLPLRGRADSVLIAGDLAVITGERSMCGTGPDGAGITLAGPTALIVRPARRHLAHRRGPVEPLPRRHRGRRGVTRWSQPKKTSASA
jgi:hypothetical protein